MRKPVWRLKMVDGYEFLFEGTRGALEQKIASGKPFQVSTPYGMTHVPRYVNPAHIMSFWLNVK
jgi:hypothetical protein